MATTSTSSLDLTTSALDVASIVDNLIYVDAAPVRNMQSKVTTLQSKVSAYQSLNTKLSALADKVSTMLFGSTETQYSVPYSFASRLSESIFSKCNVTSSNSDLISATASNATVGGSYAITVASLAKAQSMASGGFTAITDSVGTGSFTIDTGSSDPVTITINSTNGTLAGLRDAINNANAGVTATILNDGSATPYRLLLRANSTGTANAFTSTSNLSGGQALGLTQTQAASDAQFSVNGISITKSSNTVSDVIDGVTFTLTKETDSPVTISVDKDIDSIVKALNDIVTAYNSVATSINSQFTFNTTTKTAGLLAGDATLRQIQSSLQTQLSQSISNRFTKYGVATQIGMSINRDGTLTLSESKLREALSKDFTSVAALFLGDGTEAGSASASDSRVTYAGKTSATQSGTYAVQVTTLAQQAGVTGSQAVTSLSSNETLTIISGSATAVVNLLQNDSLSTVISKINSAFSAQGMAAAAADDGTGKLKISTNGYGSSQNISVFSDGAGSAGTTGFSAAPSSATGVDIAGTIGGNAATGSGLTLTGAAGQPEEGLSLTIAQSNTGNYGTVTVASSSNGTEGSSVLMNLYSVLDGITDPLSGPVHNATDGLSQNIDALNDQIESYQLRLDKEKEMLTMQFNQANEALKLMSVAQAQLNAQLSSLAS
jgi:flagellar hook-associated protein 2